MQACSALPGIAFVKSAPASIPTATYRLQLFGHLRFTDALGLVEYLRELGIGSLYLSPFFRASRGSTHGYDMVDPSQVEPLLGTEEEFGALAQRGSC